MVFQCINIRQVPWKVLKTAAFGLDFQHLPRDLANVNAWKTMFDPYNQSRNKNKMTAHSIWESSRGSEEFLWENAYSLPCKGLQNAFKLKEITYVFIACALERWCTLLAVA